VCILPLFDEFVEVVGLLWVALEVMISVLRNSDCRNKSRAVERLSGSIIMQLNKVGDKHIFSQD
jgi:hypothetical protein